MTHTRTIIVALVTSLVLAAFAESSTAKAVRSVSPGQGEYYTPADFRRILFEYRNSFSTDISNRPSEYSLTLREFPSAGHPSYQLASIPGQPGRTRRRKIQADNSLKLTLADLQAHAKKGYLIFQRSETAPHLPISTVTHLAFVYDPVTGRLLESQPLPDKPEPKDFDGVGFRPYDRFWKNQSMWAIKKVENMSDATRAEIVDPGHAQKYLGTKYWPRGIPKLTVMNIDAILPWMDKNDKTNMSCSKFVWWAYKDYDIDLDSRRTKSWQAKWFYQNDNFRYLGVSPDNIFWHQRMSKEIAYKTSGKNWAEFLY